MSNPKYCVECRYSNSNLDNYSLKCTHPKVNMTDPWALAAVKIGGTSCREEREGGFFSLNKCGKSGKLWIQKV